MNYGKENYNYKNLLKKNKEINVNVEQGTKTSIKASITGSSKYLLNRHEKYNFKTNIRYSYPIKEDDKIGTVDVYIEENKVQTRDIIAKEPVEEYNFKYCFKKVLDWFILQ